MSEEVDYTVSSGNVFADLGLEEPEQELAKAALAYKINQIIAERGWTLAEAAAAPGIDQPEASALTDGRLDELSTDRLIRLLNVLDHDVTIVVLPKPPSRLRAGVAVRFDSETSVAT